jgi:replicative DNA helicase
MEIYSLKVEKHVLGGLLKYSNLFPEVQRFITEKDFVNEVHSTIFSVISNILNNGGNLDKVILSEKIKNLGISFNEEIDIYRYIDNISFTQITEEATLESAKELLKLRVRREIHGVGKKIQDYSKGCGTESLSDIVSNCDKIYGDKMQEYEIEDEPVNLFENVEELVEERGNSPESESGLQTPYAEFNRMYGGLREGNIYAIVSRPAQGKTTFISNMLIKSAAINNVPALILDTEMSTVDIQFRVASSLTGIPMWFLETGNWRKREDYVKTFRSKIKQIKNMKCDHYFVGNKNIDQICSMVRRWYFSKVGRGNKCILAYDYVKLTGERVAANWAEHQAIGDKIDKLKKLSEEINAPIITAMQMNRSGERGAQGALVDDSSAISLSDRLQWFASFVAIFRRKSLEEMAEDGDRFGTHKLIPLKTRFQGKDAAGHHDIIRRTLQDGSERFMNNFLNFQVENFDIEERGSLRDIVNTENENFAAEDESPNDGELF